MATTGPGLSNNATPRRPSLSSFRAGGMPYSPDSIGSPLPKQSISRRGTNGSHSVRSQNNEPASSIVSHSTGRTSSLSSTAGSVGKTSSTSAKSYDTGPEVIEDPAGLEAVERPNRALSTRSRGQRRKSVLTVPPQSAFSGSKERSVLNRTLSIGKYTCGVRLVVCEEPPIPIRKSSINQSNRSASSVAPLPRSRSRRGSVSGSRTPVTTATTTIAELDGAKSVSLPVEMKRPSIYELPANC